MVTDKFHMSSMCFRCFYRQLEITICSLFLSFVNQPTETGKKNHIAFMLPHSVIYSVRKVAFFKNEITHEPSKKEIRREKKT